MRIFSFSEAWGPFHCEHAGCKEAAWAAVLNDADAARVAALPEGGTGPIAAAYILDHRLGVMACEDHLPDPNHVD